MIQETAGWIVLIVAIIALIAAFAFPPTRPYAKRYFWVLIAVAAIGVGLIVLRKRVGRTLEDSVEDQKEGHEIADGTLEKIGAIADYAHAEQARIDAELGMGQLQNQQEKDVAQAKIDTAAEITDSLERRRAFIRLAETSS